MGAAMPPPTHCAAPGMPPSWRRMEFTTTAYSSRRNTLLYILLLIFFHFPPEASALSSDSVHQDGGRWDPTAGVVMTNISRDVILQFLPANISHILNHIAVDYANEDIYLGAVNRLYQLDGVSMKPINQVVTGPRLDSHGCHASGCNTDIVKSLTNNYNKVLVIASSTDSIIACGSVSQGACDTYRRGNLSVHKEFIPKAVAANDPHSSTFAFVGPERYSTFGISEPALYIGVTYTGLGNYRHDVPALSTRNLVNLDLSKYTFSEHSLLTIDVKVRDHFLVNYVYGFYASNYVYFITVQKKSHLPGQDESGYISRMSRICVSDENYDSYTEITLECHGKDKTYYNLVQDATIFEAGDDLARRMGISRGDKVMIAAFSESVGHSNIPRKATALCAYSVKHIDEIFDENIHMCFNGSRKFRSMEYISGILMDGKCPADRSHNIRDFCEVGLKISGSTPLRTTASLALNDSLITSVIATSAGAHSVAFMATSHGTIKKVLLESPDNAVVYKSVAVDPGNAILKDMKFATNNKHIYALTNYKASKVRVESCEVYTDCGGCLRARVQSQPLT